ncbi:hypothetical protein [Kocuria rosea]|uniref:hypothetical protein n=1 Tax=Kocuria rosea TaxID=1275 RepID=UPI00119F404A|nr:hypothetical protein [Kocuria rosea]
MSWVKWVLYFWGYVLAQESLRAWAGILVDVVGHLAWPAVVLALGLFFSGPIRKLLNDGRLKSLTGPGFTLEREVEGNVVSAREDLDATPVHVPERRDTSEAKSESEEREAIGKPTGSEAPKPSEERPEDAPIESNEVPATPRWGEPIVTFDNFKYRLPRATNEMIRVSPSAAIVDSAEDLRRTLNDLLRVVKDEPVEPSRPYSLRHAVAEAGMQGLLVDSEVNAAIKLAITRDRVVDVGSNEEVTAETAAEYAQLCQRLMQSARKAALFRLGLSKAGLERRLMNGS